MIVATVRFHWGLNGLDYLLIIELLILLCSAIFWAIGEVVGRNNPRDGLMLTMRAFWQEFLRRGTESAPALQFAPSEVEQQLDRYAMKQQKKADVQKASASSSAVLNVKVVPGASRNQIAGRLGEDVKIQVTAPPEGGEANKAVIDLLADCLDIQAYRIKLVRGHYQPRKSFQIAGLSLEQVNEKLAKFF
jgi:uncharacterized protein (TIGR00251 family)